MTFNKEKKTAEYKLGRKARQKHCFHFNNNNYA